MTPDSPVRSLHHLREIHDCCLRRTQYAASFGCYGLRNVVLISKKANRGQICQLNGKFPQPLEPKPQQNA